MNSSLGAKPKSRGQQRSLLNHHSITLHYLSLHFTLICKPYTLKTSSDLSKQTFQAPMIADLFRHFVSVICGFAT